MQVSGRGVVAAFAALCDACRVSGPLHMGSNLAYLRVGAAEVVGCDSALMTGVLCRTLLPAQLLALLE